MPFSLRRLFGGCRESGSEHMSDIKLIVGLGNPGKGYEGTRHNAGFEVLDALGRQNNIEIRKKKFGGLFGDGVIGFTRVLLLKPQNFMNRSGQSTATAAGFYKIPLEKIMVVTDDMALDCGVIRIRPKGSSGGHNGLKDIRAKLGSDAYGRLRIGIGKSEFVSTTDYVLGKPSAAEKEEIEKAKQQAVKALHCWINEGIDAAMNKFNVRKSEDN